MSQTATTEASTSATPSTTNPGRGDFCWFELHTRNVAAVKRFYNTMFGWTTIESPMSGFVYHHLMKDGVGFGGIMDMNSPEWGDVPSHWMSYFRVADCDHAAALVTKLGGNVCVPPTVIPTVGKFCVANDPTGGSFSLISLENPKPIASVIAWNELMTRDSKKATEFYSKLLGWTMQPMQMGGPVPYMVCINGESSIGGIFSMDNPKFAKVPPCWMNYIGTKRIDEDASKVEKLGGKVIVQPYDIPNNIGRCCEIQDPSGAPICLYQSARNC